MRRDTIRGRYRVYMNYCTISYTAAWWDWKRWEREIDYMAMNGVNMPLAVVGLEAVWYNTLLRYGFTDIEARRFLAGPAHAAWQWMQNLQSYGGPLPKSWIDSHRELGLRIIRRERELGMQPIQQGFSGYVPRELQQKFPHTAIRRQPSWCGFEGAAQLDPTDSLFQAFGRDFLQEQRRLYGAYGAYAADPFHESAPPVDTPEYLAAEGHSIHQLLKRFDPDALWVMQAWSLREPIVKAVSRTDLLILDLNGAKAGPANAYFGDYPYVTGNLHNFGWKEWAGLIEGYYLPRWRMFYDMLAYSLRAGRTYSERGLRLTHGREAFRANAFYQQLADWELAYAHRTGKARTPVTEGDEVSTARRLFVKYRRLSAEYARTVGAAVRPEGERYENLGR